MLAWVSLKVAAGMRSGRRSFGQRMLGSMTISEVRSQCYRVLYGEEGHITVSVVSGLLYPKFRVGRLKQENEFIEEVRLV
jgi:hypothetical protein